MNPSKCKAAFSFQSKYDLQCSIVVESVRTNVSNDLFQCFPVFSESFARRYFCLKPATTSKKTPAHVFPCEFCKIFKNSYCTEHLRATALLFSTQIMRESGTKWVNSLQSSVAFHIETSHLICFIWLIKISSTCNLKGKHLLSQSISGEQIPQVKNYMFKANTRNQRPI